jgi:hypothetical protein
VSACLISSTFGWSYGELEGLVSASFMQDMVGLDGIGARGNGRAMMHL